MRRSSATPGKPRTSTALLRSTPTPPTTSHPSLPNYLALTGASTFGITSDCSPSVCPVKAINVMDRIEGAGLSWKAYMEGMPASCTTSDAYPYMV